MMVIYIYLGGVAVGIYIMNTFLQSCVNAISQLFCLNGFVINYYQAPRLLIEQLVLIFFTLGIDLLLAANVYGR